MRRIFFLAVALSLVPLISFAENTSDTKETLSFEELRELQKTVSVLLLDARGLKSFEEGHIQDAKLPLTDAYYQNEELFRQGLLRDAPVMNAALKEAMK